MKFNPLFITPQWLKEYHTKYPHGLSVLENIIEWVNLTNEIIAHVNISPDKITEILEMWKNDGTLYTIMGNALVGYPPIKAVTGTGRTVFRTEDIDSVSLADGETPSWDLETSTTADIYALYNQLLVDYPDMFFRNHKGYASDASGQPDLSLPIYEYVLIDPISVKVAQYSSYKNVGIVSGIHGDEKGSVYATYHLIRQILEGKNEYLNKFRTYARIYVIPVANPSGYNNNKRTNARGVDINRNFDYEWNQGVSDPQDDRYRGESAYSELETQLLRDWSRERASLDITFIDAHNDTNNTWYSTRGDLLKAHFSDIMRDIVDYLEERYKSISIRNQSRTTFHTHPSSASFINDVGQFYENFDRATIIENRFYAIDNPIKYPKDVIMMYIDILGNYIINL